MKKIGLILGLLNTVAVLAVLGLFVYTKILYKHPPITEAKERAKLQVSKPKVVENFNPVLINLDPITANLDPFSDEKGKQKVHYVSLTLAIEIKDQSFQVKFEEAKPITLDKILFILSKKKFEDLNQVQGRYIFRSQVIDAMNEYFADTLVTEVFFSDFLLQ
jgi:flagellar basal body-associated protein FliL